MADFRRSVWVASLRIARHSAVGFTAIFCLCFMTACSFIPRDSFTEEEQFAARIPGFPIVRYWADGKPSEWRPFTDNANLEGVIKQTGHFDVLAISGGGYDGAYGAGVINGWTATGTRPSFTIVTGVSAGALIAPLAFLGPDYDKELTEAFTGGLTEILGGPGVLALLGTADIRKESLTNIISRFVNRRLLQAIAAEHAKGRRLLVVTTNLDAQRAVVWDMGAIAASGNPDALQLFIDVLAASASIPGVFAPSMIEAEAKNGHRFREMHVDGGATTQIFILPDAALASSLRVIQTHGAKSHVWALVNNRLTPEFEVVEGGVLPIAARSFSTLIKSDARGTLLATRNYVRGDAFNLTYIDHKFAEELVARYRSSLTPGFNTEYMRAVYEYGYRKALSGRLWEKQVPLPGPPDPRLRTMAVSR